SELRSLPSPSVNERRTHFLPLDLDGRCSSPSLSSPESVGAIRCFPFMPFARPPREFSFESDSAPESVALGRKTPRSAAPNWTEWADLGLPDVDSVEAAGMVGGCRFM